MASYVRDGKGTVHVLDVSGQGEYTFCGFAYDCGAVEPEDVGQDEMTPTRGPSTCVRCKEQIEEIRKALVGVKFRVDQ